MQGPAKAAALLVLAALLNASAVAGPQAPLPFLSPIFGDNMVLQRGKPNPIWGWAAPGDSIRVGIDGRWVATVAGNDGRWEVRINPPPAGGPYTVQVDGAHDQHMVLHEILVGDVWLCGGQSNMEMPLTHARDGSNDVASAFHPEIRLFKVGSHPAYSPAPVIHGRWKICSPQTVAEDGGFSAVGYYFANRIQEDIHVPVGLVEDCLGGTPAEAWTSADTLRKLGVFTAGLDEMERLKSQGALEYGNFIMHWYDDYDIGLKGKPWSADDFDDSNWQTVPVPGGFKELGVANSPSVCWFRRHVTLPDPLPPGPASLQLGVVEKMDTSFINGQWVGASAWVENPRNYAIASGVLRPGDNVLAIRVLKTRPDGGFMSQPNVLRIVLGGGQSVPLAGPWKAAVSVDARPPHPLPLGYENWPVMPSVLYQGMIEPLAPLAISGAIWYQGEANAGRGSQYRRLLPAMIGDWRRRFGQGDFPFYIVSLPAFMPHRTTPPAADDWAELRDAQAFVARTVRNSALAVTIDTGEANNIHPKDKRAVGERLAYCALAGHYGEKIPWQGPSFRKLKPVAGGLKVEFDHVEGGFVVKGDRAGEFAVAGPDHQWYWANATVEGEAVIVTCPAVPDPVAVRYAWQSNPAATLYNRAGLPAVPFRTDNWDP